MKANHNESFVQRIESKNKLSFTAQSIRLKIVKPALLTMLVATLGVGITGCGKSIKPETHEPTKLVRLSQDAGLLTPVLSENIGSKILGYAPSALQVGYANNTAIVASSKGEVVQYDNQGRVVWSTDLNTQIVSGVSYDPVTHTAVVTTRDAYVIALDTMSGEVRWRQQLNGTVLSPALIHNDRVVVSGNDGVLRGLSLQTGESIWQFVIQAPAISIRGTARPILLNDEAALFATADGRLHALDIDTGIPRWTRRVGTPKGNSEVERMSDVDSTPVVDNNQLFAVSYSGQLLGIDLISREVMFVNPVASLRDLAVTDTSVIVTTLEGYVEAYDRNTGELLWSNKQLAYRNLTNPVVTSSTDYIAVGDMDGVIHVLQSNTGRIVSRQKTKGSLQSLQIQSDTILGLSDSGDMTIWRFGQ